MDEITTATLTVTFHGGHVAPIERVDLGLARQQWARFADWAALGGVNATRDEWPDSTALDVTTERGDRIAAAYASIAMLHLAEEAQG